MQVLEGHEGVVHALSFSPSGETLVSAGRDGSLRRWEAWGSCTEQSRTGSPVHALAWSADGCWLATGGGDGSLQVWDAAGQTMRANRPGNGGVVTGLAFLNDETLVFTKGIEPGRPGDMSESIRFWDWPSGKVRPPLPVNIVKGDPIKALAVLPDQHRLAWVSHTNALTIWNPIKSDATHMVLKAPCRALAFAPDGKTLAATADWKIVLIDADRGHEPLTLAGHKGVVSSLTYTPDGRHLISGGWDKTVKFWDATSGRDVASFEWPVGRVYAVAVAPDGLRAAAAGDLGTIVVWDVDL